MPAMPDSVSKAWDDRNGPIVFTTVADDGTPNSIYASCVKKAAEDKLVVADNYFAKTRANILGGSTGSILFITNEGKSFQVKGSIEYLKSGEIYDDMLTWAPERLPRVAVAVLTVEEAYSGAEKLS